jgi:hypothetical protein
LGNQPIEFTADPNARQRCVGNQRQAFARAVVDDRQDAEAPPVGELVRHEVERPALVRA